MARWLPIDGSSPTSKLVLTDPDFTFEDTVYTSEPHREIYGGAWSRDGTEVAFFEGSYESGATLKILNLSTGEDRPLCSFSSMGNPPRRVSWAGASDRLVFDINGTMYLLDGLSSPGTPTPLGPGFGPAWSPDDTQIVYDTRAGVYVKTLYGSEPDLSIGGQYYSDWRRDPPQ